MDSCWVELCGWQVCLGTQRIQLGTDLHVTGDPTGVACLSAVGWQLPRDKSCPGPTISAKTQHQNISRWCIFYNDVSKAAQQRNKMNKQTNKQTGSLSGLVCVTTDGWDISKWEQNKKENKNVMTLLISEISNSQGCLSPAHVVGRRPTVSTPWDTRAVCSSCPRALWEGRSSFGR